jgi:mannose-6-phosphate isomerase-like protein (cupin superfamily)
MSAQAFDLTSILEEPRAAGASYVEFLRRPRVSLGLYTVPVGSVDGQHPHAADEVYLVQSGHGVLRVGDQTYPLSPGSIVSVDHGVDHAFVEVAEDLKIVVVFAPPEAPSS